MRSLSALLVALPGVLYALKDNPIGAGVLVVLSIGGAGVFLWFKRK